MEDYGAKNTCAISCDGLLSATRARTPQHTPRGDDASVRPDRALDDGLAPAAAALRGLTLAERAVRATGEPQVDARLVEGAAATGEAPHSLAELEVADADGARLLAIARVRIGLARDRSRRA